MCSSRVRLGIYASEVEKRIAAIANSSRSLSLRPVKSIGRERALAIVNSRGDCHNKTGGRRGDSDGANRKSRDNKPLFGEGRGGGGDGF